MQLKQGTQLQNGKYHIERTLGSGGFGITYLATEPSLNRKVAIKEFFMKEHCNRDAETSHVSVPSVGSRELVKRFRTKFVKEAQAIAQLKHAHIVSIHATFEENGTAYYVMEYHNNGSLADLINERRTLPEEEAVRYIRQIADALDYLHHRQMNHLDIKPGNILIDENGNTVLIDFGLSKRYDQDGVETSSTPVGISHGYAPLEQYEARGVSEFSPATDIYSLAATLYKLLTGSTPPRANDIFNDGLPTLPSSVSPTVANAIEKAMQPKRKDRPQTIPEFLALLDDENIAACGTCDSTMLDGTTAAGAVNKKNESTPEEKKEDKQAAKNDGKGKKSSSKKIIVWIVVLIIAAAAGVGAFLFISSQESGKKEAGTAQSSNAKRAEEGSATNKDSQAGGTATAGVDGMETVGDFSKDGSAGDYSEYGDSALFDSAYYVNETYDNVEMEQAEQQEQVAQSEVQGQEASAQEQQAASHENAGSNSQASNVQKAGSAGQPNSVRSNSNSNTAAKTPATASSPASKPTASKSATVSKSTTASKSTEVNKNVQSTAASGEVQTRGSSAVNVTRYAPAGTQSTGSSVAPSATKLTAVDLGLSVLWADYNAGAGPNNIYGELYKWGNHTDNGWRLPTEKEMKELLNCDWKPFTKDGKKGYIVSNNGESIFLPAAGFQETGKSKVSGGNWGCYWTSDKKNGDPRYLKFNNGSRGNIESGKNSDKYSIRYVRNK